MSRLSVKNKTLLSVVALITGRLWYPVGNANEPTAATEFGKILNPLTAKKLLPGYYFAVYKGGEKVFERTEGRDERPISPLAKTPCTPSRRCQSQSPRWRYLP